MGLNTAENIIISVYTDDKSKDYNFQRFLHKKYQHVRIFAATFFDTRLNTLKHLIIGVYTRFS